MANKKKFYAVKKGKATGIFLSWEETQIAIRDTLNPEYRAFESQEEAQAYLDGVDLIFVRDIQPRLKENTVVAFVDGSYDAISGAYSSGAYLLLPNGKNEKLKSQNDASEFQSRHNIPGEIFAVLMVVDWVIKAGYQRLAIFYDYEGLEKWADGTWKANNSLTKMYQKTIQEKGQKIDIEFVKVKGHSNNIYNDKADQLARSVLEVKKNKNASKESHGIMILNEGFHGVKYTQQFNTFKEAFAKFGMILSLLKNGEEKDYLNKPIYSGVDFVLFYDKDLVLAQNLEMNGIRVFNSQSAIASCDDKALTYLALRDLKDIKLIPTLVSPLKFFDRFSPADQFIIDMQAHFAYPFIIKETHGSFGEQVYLVRNENELEAVLQKIGNHQFLAQEYIQASYGRDLRLWLVNHQVVFAAQRRQEQNDEFRSSISQGAIYDTDIVVPEFLKKQAAAVSKKLHLDFGTVDFLYGPNPDEYYLCEVNTNGFFPPNNRGIAEKIAQYIAKEVHK